MLPTVSPVEGAGLGVVASARTDSLQRWGEQERSVAGHHLPQTECPEQPASQQDLPGGGEDQPGRPGHGPGSPVCFQVFTLLP